MITIIKDHNEALEKRVFNDYNQLCQKYFIKNDDLVMADQIFNSALEKAMSYFQEKIMSRIHL